MATDASGELVEATPSSIAASGHGHNRCGVGVETPLALAWSVAGQPLQVGIWEGCERVLQATLPTQGGLAGLAIGGEPLRLCTVISTDSASAYRAVCATLPAP